MVMVLTGALIGAAVGLSAEEVTGYLRSELKNRRFRKRLASVVIDKVGVPPYKGSLTKWLGTTEAQDLLTQVDNSNAAQIAEMMDGLIGDVQRKAKDLQGEERTLHCQRLAATLKVDFLRLSDPRTALLHHTLLGLPAAVATEIESRTGQINVGHLPARTTERLDTLAETHPATVREFATLATSANDLRHTLGEWLKHDPPWIHAAPTEVWLAAADLADAHGLSAIEAQCLERVRVAGGADPDGYLEARLAITLHDLDETNAALELISDYGFPRPPLLDLAELYITGGHDRIIQIPDVGVPATAGDRLIRAVMIASLQRVGNLHRALQLAELALESDLVSERLRAQIGLILTGLSDTEPNGSHSQAAHRRSALEHLLIAIEEIKGYGGSTLELTRTATRLGAVVGQPETIARLGMPAPKGIASTDEVEDPEIAADTTMALLFLDRRTEASEIARLHGESAYPAKLLAAVEALETEASDASEALTAALEVAPGLTYQIPILGNMADRGHPLPDLAELRQANPEVASLIEARHLSSTGKVDQAISLLRPLAPGSVLATERLAECLDQNNKTEEAITLLTTSAKRMGSMRLGLAAVLVLKREDRIAEADDVAQRTLLIQGDPHAEFQLRASLMDSAAQRDDWTELAEQSRNASNAFPDLPEPAWALVHALVRKHRLTSALEEMDRRPHVEPHDDAAAATKIHLLSQLRPGEETVRVSIKLREQFPDSERVAAAASIAAITAAGDLPSDLVPVALTAMAEFTNRFPDSEHLWAVDVGDTAESIIEALRPHLQDRQVAIESILEKVRWGQLPLGFLANFVGVPYTGALLAVSPYSAPLVSIAPTKADRDREVKTALDHIESTLVFDASAIVTGQRTGTIDLLENLPGQRLSPESVLDDAHRNLQRARSETGNTLSWDTTTDRPTLTETDEAAQHAGISEAQAIIDRITRSTTSVSTATVEQLVELESTNFEEPSWLDAIRLARHEGAALVCDDWVLRVIAHRYGVEAFSTHALFSALVATGVITQLRFSHIVDELFRTGHVDVPLDQDHLDRISRSEPALALSGFARPAIWATDSQTALRFVDDTIGELSADPANDEVLYSWVARSSEGLAHATQPHATSKLLGLQLAAAIMFSDRRIEHARDMLEAVRWGQHRAKPGVESDPLPYAVQAISDQLSELEGIDVPQAILTVLQKLEPADKQTVVTSIIEHNSTRS